MRLSESAAKFSPAAEEKIEQRAELDRARSELRRTTTAEAPVKEAAAAEAAGADAKEAKDAQESRALRAAGNRTLRAGKAAAREYTRTAAAARDKACLSHSAAAEVRKQGADRASIAENDFAAEKDALVNEKRTLSARLEKERAKVADLEGRLQTLESTVSALRKSSEAESAKLKEKAKTLKTDAARFEAERDSLKAQLKGKTEIAAAFGFKAKVEAAVKSRLKSQVEELRREVAARSGAAEAAMSRLAQSEEAAGGDRGGISFITMI